MKILKNLLLKNHWANLNQTWHKASLGRRDSSLFKCRANLKLYWKYLKFFFSRTTWPISTKIGTKHPWMEGIQVCSNGRPRPSLRRDNNEIIKLYWKYLKILFSISTVAISTKHSTKHPWMEGIRVYSNERPYLSSRGDNSKNLELYCKYIKIFFSWTAVLILSKLGTKNPWMKGIQVYSNI